MEGIEETDEKEPVSRISEKEGKEQETKLPPVIELPGEVAEPSSPIRPKRFDIPYCVTIARAIRVAFSISFAAPVVTVSNTICSYG